MTETIEQIKQSEVRRHFGSIAFGRDGRPEERWERGAMTTFLSPYRFRLAWDPKTTIRHLTCHRGAHHSLAAILSAIKLAYETEEERAELGLDLFGGCYFFAPGPVLTMHAYGLAICIDPSGNPPGQKWEEGMIPMGAVDIFEEHGWSWGGRSKPFNCGEFQLPAP